MKSDSISSVKGIKGVTTNKGGNFVVPVGFGNHLYSGGAGHNKGIKQALLNFIACYVPIAKKPITAYKGTNPAHINSTILLSAITKQYPHITTIQKMHNHTYGLRKIGIVLGGNTTGVQQFIINPLAFGVLVGKGKHKVLGGGYTVPKKAPNSLLAQVRKVNGGCVL